jgi:hypothetical protein
MNLLNIPKAREMFRGVMEEMANKEYPSACADDKQWGIKPMTIEEFRKWYFVDAERCYLGIGCTLKNLFELNKSMQDRVNKCIKQLWKLLGSRVASKDTTLEELTDLMESAIETYNKNPNIVKAINTDKKKRSIISSSYSMFKAATALHSKEAFNEADPLIESVTSKNEAIELRSDNIENLKLLDPYISEGVKKELYTLLNQLGPTVPATFYYLLQEAARNGMGNRLHIDIKDYLDTVNKSHHHRNKVRLLNDLDVMMHAHVTIEVSHRINGKRERVRTIKSPLLAYTDVEQEREIGCEDRKKWKLQEVIVQLGEWVTPIKELMEGRIPKQGKQVVELPSAALKIDHGRHENAFIFGAVLLNRWRNSENKKKEKDSLVGPWEVITVRQLLKDSKQWDKMQEQVAKRGLFDRKRGPYYRFEKNLAVGAEHFNFIWEWDKRPRNKKEFFDGKIIFTKAVDEKIETQGGGKIDTPWG